MIDKDVVVLQNCTNSVMEVQDPCGETNTTSADASQAINIKVEKVSDAEEEGGPVPITFPEIKVEPEVSACLYMSIVKIKISLHKAVEVCRVRC
jgi:hypothetical protein